MSDQGLEDLKLDIERRLRERALIAARLPMYSEELRALQDALRKDDDSVWWTDQFWRNGRHIYGHAEGEDILNDGAKPVDYLPSKHGTSILRIVPPAVGRYYEESDEGLHIASEIREITNFFERKALITCPVCYQQYQTSLSAPFDLTGDEGDLLLVFCSNHNSTVEEFKDKPIVDQISPECITWLRQDAASPYPVEE